MTLFLKLAKEEDGRLMSQSKHLVGVWMPDSSIESERERRYEELKSKGSLQREREWGGKVKESSVFQNISRVGSSLLISSFCCSYSQVERVRLSLHELNKGTCVYSHTERQGPLRQAVMCGYNITFVVLGSVMKELALIASSLGPETVEGIVVVTTWIEKLLTDLKVQHK